MKPYQYDMLEMQADKLARYSIELFCMTSILEELLSNSFGNLPQHITSDFANIVNRHAKHLQNIAIKLHCDIEYQIND